MPAPPALPAPGTTEFLKLLIKFLQALLCALSLGISVHPCLGVRAADIAEYVGITVHAVVFLLTRYTPCLWDHFRSLPAPARDILRNIQQFRSYTFPASAIRTAHNRLARPQSRYIVYASGTSTRDTFYPGTYILPPCTSEASADALVGCNMYAARAQYNTPNEPGTLVNFPDLAFFSGWEMTDVNTALYGTAEFVAFPVMPYMIPAIPAVGAVAAPAPPTSAPTPAPVAAVPAQALPLPAVAAAPPPAAASATPAGPLAPVTKAARWSQLIADANPAQVDWAFANCDTNSLSLPPGVIAHLA